MLTEVLNELEEQLQQEIPCESLHGCDKPAEWLVRILPPHTFRGTVQRSYRICTKCKEDYTLELRLQLGSRWITAIRFIKL